MTTRRRLRAPVTAFVLCSLLTVSCSDSGSNGETENTAGPSATTAPTSSTAPAEPQNDTANSAPTSNVSPPPSTMPPADPLVAGVDIIQVRSPQGGAAGATPQFRWEQVETAEDYRLVVLGPDGPIWAWQGTETSVWLGGFTVEPPPGATSLAIVDDTCWSVVARDAEGSILAASALLPITPMGEPDHDCDPG